MNNEISFLCIQNGKIVEKNLFLPVRNLGNVRDKEITIIKKEHPYLKTKSALSFKNFLMGSNRAH